MKRTYLVKIGGKYQFWKATRSRMEFESFSREFKKAIKYLKKEKKLKIIEE